MARRFVRACLGPDAPDDAVLLTQLLVGELVTNAVRHARLGESDTIAVRLEARAGWLRAEVADPGPCFDPSALDLGAEPFRGLAVVDRIATRWGVGRSPCLVWFELEQDPGHG
jgi:anti-sigma regulatory factor (Ser/Thr protein kinase)